MPLEQRYHAENAADIIVHPLDIMTLIYQRRSGMTHIVAEPVPQILEVMGADILDAADIAKRLIAAFDLAEFALYDPPDIVAIVSERLAELAALGLVERVVAT